MSAGRFVFLLMCWFFYCGVSAHAATDEAARAVEKAQSLFDAHQYFPALKAAKAAERLTAKLSDANFNPKRAQALLLLASSMHATGEILQAEPVYKQALQAFKRLGKSHEQDLLEAFGRLGVLYQDAGREILAGIVFDRVRYRGKDLLGAEHPEIVKALNRIGEHEDSGAQAKDAFQKAFVASKGLAEDHPERIRVRVNIGEVFRTVMPDEEINEFLKTGKTNWKSPPRCANSDKMAEVLDLFESGAVADPPLHIYVVSAYAKVFRSRGNETARNGFPKEAGPCWEQAQQYLERAVRMSDALYGYRHPYVAKALITLGVFHYDRERYGDAIKDLEKALRVLRSRFRESHPQIKSAMSLLRYAYRDSGNKGKADAIAAKLKALPEYTHTDFKLAYVTTRDWDEKKKAYKRRGTSNALSYGTATVRADIHSLFDRFDRIVESAGEADKSTAPLSYAKNFKILNVSPGSLNDVEQSIVKATKNSIRFPGQALLFVHGYNVTHEQAVKRAAQIAYDLEFDGALILFSWNSYGSHAWYMGDRKRAEAAAEPLFKFLDQLAIILDKVKVHVIAHSMGNRVLSRAIDKFAQRAPHARFPNLGEIIMAHSDIDLDWCRKMGRAKRFSRGVTNYVNAGDWALWVSSTIRLGEGRCGRVAQSYPGVETVDTTGMGGRAGQSMQSHHGVFVNDPVLFGDMYRLLATGRRPVHERTPAFRSVRDEGKPAHWVYDESTDAAGAVAEK